MLYIPVLPLGRCLSFTSLTNGPALFSGVYDFSLSHLGRTPSWVGLSHKFCGMCVSFCSHDIIRDVMNIKANNSSVLPLDG